MLIVGSWNKLLYNHGTLRLSCLTFEWMADTINVYGYIAKEVYKQKQHITRSTPKETKEKKSQVTIKIHNLLLIANPDSYQTFYISCLKIDAFIFPV